MRDIFSEIFSTERAEAPDPVAAARRAARPQLRRRFYQNAQVGAATDGFAVLLDGKPVRTPARRTLAAPCRGLAEAIAAEWEAQRDLVDPASMPLTRLANSIIDGVADTRGPVRAEIEKYLGSDLLFYRAGSPAVLRERQAQRWDPLLDWAGERCGTRFLLSEGVMHVAQPQTALSAAARLIPDDPWRLGAMHAITTITGSALLALALLDGRLSVEEAFAAAHVDEDFQMEQWGRDALAMERREFRRAEFDAAARVLELLASAIPGAEPKAR
jgi:chaperone required for assembly of F1-ATPase